MENIKNEKYNLDQKNNNKHIKGQSKQLLSYRSFIGCCLSDQKNKMDKKLISSVFARLSSCMLLLTGKKDEDDSKCSYRLKVSNSNRSILIDCRECDFDSSFDDANCRKNLFELLLKEGTVRRVTLYGLYERDYEGKTLETIYLMAQLKDRLVHHKVLKSFYEECINNNCYKEKEDLIDNIIQTSWTDPLQACFLIESGKIYYNKKVNDTNINDRCFSCRKESMKTIHEMGTVSEKIINHIENCISAPMHLKCCEAGIESTKTEYEKYLRSYVRPPFSTSRIYTEPPENTIFLECYDISYQEERKLPVNIYQLTDRPEKMYMINPPEYSLEENELRTIERVRKKMISYRPSDLNFADPSCSREYFYKLSRQLLMEDKDSCNIVANPVKTKLFCDLLTKYTSGLGIIEDIISDNRVTDVYVNAPADRNPVHVVFDGEECVTNIYLSQEDIDSMVSRLRSISGRPFGEATPVLEMTLEQYGVRVSVVGDPLSASGIAYAFRKHAKDPWTLPKMISNGSISPLTAGVLSFIMEGQASVLVAGGVGAGKTSLMCALLLEIPQKYRMISIEDTPELPILKLQEMGWKVQGLNSRSAIMKYGIEIEPSVALRASLRLGSSSLIMGEVRGAEVAVLYEAMQVGAAGNSVIGTVHGSSTKAVYERIVNTLKVPPTSFKATDAVIVCANTRMSASMETKRRIIQIAEVNDKWRDTEEVFSDILTYDTSADCLLPSDIMDRGQSVLIARIADKWGISIDEASRNIRMRAKIKEIIAEYGKDNSCLLDAENVAIANNMFWMLMDKEKAKPDYKSICNKWLEWFKDFAKKAKLYDKSFHEQANSTEKNYQIMCPGDQAAQ